MIRVDDYTDISLLCCFISLFHSLKVKGGGDGDGDGWMSIKPDLCDLLVLHLLYVHYNSRYI